MRVFPTYGNNNRICINRGTIESPVWENDSVLVKYFNSDLPDFDRFFRTTMKDINYDGSLDVLTRRKAGFEFYTNTGTMTDPDWHYSEVLAEGLVDRDFYHYAFADLDHDGKDDLVVGTNAGKVFAYKNMSPVMPQWQKWDEIFAQVDGCAAPAFSDHDRDGDLDLFVGDKLGFLYYFENQSTVGVKKNETKNPTEFNLTNYPNPFNSSTTISFKLPNASSLNLNVYDCRGRLVFHQHNYFSVGQHKIQFKTDNLGSGVYVIQLDSEFFSAVRKCVLIK
jgi:hypothetical protein